MMREPKTNVNIVLDAYLITVIVSDMTHSPADGASERWRKVQPPRAPRRL